MCHSKWGVTPWDEAFGEDIVFMAGDYTAATDHINHVAAEVVIEGFLQSTNFGLEPYITCVL